MLRYILCASLVLAGCSSTKPSDAYYNKPVRVSCEGSTFEQAKSNCFSQAIEFAVGAVVVSETEVRNKKLAKDEILKHSSGYVDDFKIENRVDEPNRVLLIMDVTVKNSVIAERILNAQTGKGEVQGQRMGAQFTTFIKNKETGDQLLKNLLADFPKYGLHVKKGEVKYQVNIHREPVIMVPVEITWNYKYVEALKEAFKLLQDPKDRSIIQESVLLIAKDPNAWFLGSTETYYFNDVSRSRMIKETFVGKVYINLAFKDKNGNLLYASCDSGIDILPVHTSDPFRIDANRTFEGTTYYTARANSEKIHSINEIEVSLTTKPCTFVY